MARIVVSMGAGRSGVGRVATCLDNGVPVQGFAPGDAHQFFSVPQHGYDSVCVPLLKTVPRCLIVHALFPVSPLLSAHLPTPLGRSW